MAWTESDRVTIRHYLGFAAIYTQADPRLENALTAIQAVSDGGTRPDNSSELQVRGWLADLILIETNLRNLWNKAMALTVDELKVDPVRGMQMLRMEGRRLVTNLATILSTRPRRDVFSSLSPNFSGDAYEDLFLGDAGRYVP